MGKYRWAFPSYRSHKSDTVTGAGKVVLSNMHAPAPELKALRALAERYNKQFQKLLDQELEAMGAGPVVDSSGQEIQLADKVKTRTGDRCVVTRIDVRSKRVVVQHKDGHKQLLMGHRLTIVGRPHGDEVRGGSKEKDKELAGADA